MGIEKDERQQPAEVKGLGEEAFTDKRGTDKEVYIRKGKLMLEVRTSSSADIAMEVAKMALTKFP